MLWEDCLWTVVHKRPPCGVVGHLMLISKRHFQGPSAFSDNEASTIGLALRRCERALEKVTGCDRVFTAALGSAAAPHFHAHMMPVYKDAGGTVGLPAKPVSGTPFDVFLQEKLAKDGVLAADSAQCLVVAEAFGIAMAASGPSGLASEVAAGVMAARQEAVAAPPAKRARADDGAVIEGKRCQAVLFDLDDTLVMTSSIDRSAILSAATATVGQREGESVAARFTALLHAEPFPPSGSDEGVPKWRVGLWARAIGVRAPSAADPDSLLSAVGETGSDTSMLAKAAYESWSEERLANFKFVEGVPSMVARLQRAGYATGVLANGPPYYSLPTTYYSLFATHCSLPTTYYSLFSAQWSLLTTHYPPLITHHSPLTTCYLLLTTHYPILTTHYSLLPTHYSLLTIHDSLLTTH